MLDFGGADAVGERAEGAVRRRVAVAAYDRGARKRKALLRPDDVNNALARVELIEIFEVEELGVLGEIGDLGRAFRVRIGLRAVGGRHIVIDDQQRLVGGAHGTAGKPEPLEGLGTGHLVNKVAIDIDEAGAVRLLIDEMILPDFIV